MHNRQVDVREHFEERECYYSLNSTPSTLAPTGQTVRLLIAFDLGSGQQTSTVRDPEPSYTQNAGQRVELRLTQPHELRLTQTHEVCAACAKRQF